MRRAAAARRDQEPPAPCRWWPPASSRSFAAVGAVLLGGACVALAVQPTGARAGGFDLSVVGTRALARGGAVLAAVDDGSALQHNPAALVRRPGTHTYITLSPVRAEVKYRRAPLYDWSRATTSDPYPTVHYPEVHNEVPFFPLSGAGFALTTDLGLRRFAFGLGLQGPSGVGHMRFPADGPQRYQMIERDIVLASYDLALAYRHGERFGLGVTLHWIDLPRARLTMVVDANNQTNDFYPDASPYDVLVALDTADRFGLTATVGGWARLLPWLEVAAAGRVLPVSMGSEGELALRGLGDLVRGKQMYTWERTPAGLQPDPSVSLAFGYAPTARIGVRAVRERGGAAVLDVELDGYWEGWSVMDGYQVELPDVATVEGLALDIPLQDMTLDRAWRDVWGVRLGGGGQLFDGLLELNAGGFWERGAVADSYSYLDFLSFDRLGLGAGVGLRLAGLRLDLAYQHVFNEPRAVSESDGQMYQERPGSTCTGSGPAGPCDPRYPGQPGVVANAGTFLAGYDIFSVALQVDWTALLR